MTSARNLIVRADASSRIGVGHVMRCLALSQAWQDLGGKVCFVCSELPEALIQRLHEEGMLVESLAVKAGSIEDARLLMEIGERENAAALVVDGYHFGGEYLEVVAQSRATSLTVDDEGRLPWYATRFVLNQNDHADKHLYENRDDRTRLLLGTKYSLIRRELLKATTRTRARSGSINRVLVTLGGADPDGVTERVVDGLMSLETSEVHFRILVGNLSGQYSRLATVASHDSRFEILPAVRDMGIQYGWADLAIAAGGSSNWEMCCFGLPRILIVIADNQRQVVEDLSRAGAAFNLGTPNADFGRRVAETVRQLCASPERVVACGKAGKSIVDGKGAERCAQVLLDDAATHEGCSRADADAMPAKTSTLVISPASVADSSRITE